MSSENNLETKITNMEKEITELQEKITKLETFIFNNHYHTNHYNDDYNIKKEVNLDNNVSTRSIDFSEPKLMRQHAFMLTRP